MPSSITILIRSLPTPDVDYIFFRNDNVLGLIRENAKVNRTGIREMKTSTVSVGEQTLFLQQAFNLDFNAFSDFSFEFPTGDTIKIIRKTGENYFFGSFIGGNTGPTAWAEITDITSEPDEPPLEITNVSYLPSSVNPCSTLDMEVTTNKQIQLVRYNNQDINVNTNPFTINISRLSGAVLDVFANTEKYTETFYPPVQFFIDRVNTRFTPNGYAAEIVVTATGVTQTNIFNELEYSLNDVDYQMSPNFPGLNDGSFTGYVRDPYGCKKQIDFTIVDDESSVESLLEYFRFSKSNSFHFVERNDQPKNIENTLSCEEEGFNQIRFTHKVYKDEIYPNQFRSNFENHVLKLIDEQENETIVDVEKVSNNINIFDSRDAYLKVYSDNCVGVYLNGGNLYNPQTLDVLEGRSNLFGRLPSFYKKNSFIKLGNDIGWYQITDLSYDEEISSFVAKTNYRSNTVTNDPIIATVNYNQLEYEVYEFDVDWTNLEGCYYFTLERSTGDNIKYSQSELIEVGDSFERVHEIVSSNTENSDFNYNTQRQIKHRFTLPYIDLKTSDSSVNVESNRNDTNITHLKGSVTDTRTFVFDFLTEGMVQKIARIVSLDRLFINGIGYTNPEIENERLGNTNIYTMRVTLTPNNRQFESNSGLRVISNIDNGGFLIVDNTGGFLKHEN